MMYAEGPWNGSSRLGGRPRVGGDLLPVDGGADYKESGGLRRWYRDWGRRDACGLEEA